MNRLVMTTIAAAMLSTTAIAQTGMSQGGMGEEPRLNSDQRLGVENEANVSNNGSAESGDVIEEGATGTTGSVEAEIDDDIVDDDTEMNAETTIDNSDDTLGAENEATLSNNGELDRDDQVDVDTRSTGSIVIDDAEDDMDGSPDEPAEGNYSDNVTEEDVHR